MLQWYLYVPGIVNVKLKVVPLPASEPSKEAGSPASLVTVCGTLVLSVQVTVVPAFTDRLLGLKPNLLYAPPELVIETAACGPLGVLVGAGTVFVGAAVGAA